MYFIAEIQGRNHSATLDVCGNSKSEARSRAAERFCTDFGESIGDIEIEVRPMTLDDAEGQGRR